MYHIPEGTKGVISATSSGPVRIPPPLPAPPGPDMYDPRLVGEAITSGRPDIGSRPRLYAPDPAVAARLMAIDNLYALWGHDMRWMWVLSDGGCTHRGTCAKCRQHIMLDEQANWTGAPQMRCSTTKQPRYHIPADRPWWARLWLRIVIWLAG